MMNKGVTLIETVLSAALLLFVSLIGLECFISARRLFVDLKASQEGDLAAAAALESLRRDASRAGEGLSIPIELGLCDGAELRPDGFAVRYAAEVKSLAADIVPGQTKIFLESTEGLGPGRDICLCADDRAEINSVRSAGDGWIVIEPGAGNSYGRLEGFCIAIDVVTNRFDRTSRILRRRINNGSGQPLIEDADMFEAEWDPAAPLFRFRLRLNMKKGKTHETSVVPKSLALLPGTLG